MSERTDRYLAALMEQVANAAPEAPEWPGEPAVLPQPVRRQRPGWAVAALVAFAGVLAFVGLSGVVFRDGGVDVTSESAGVTIVTPDGFALSGKLTAGSSRIGIVVAGAYGAAPGELDPIVEPLVEQGFTVLTFDVRGQGPSGGAVRPDLLDDDVAAVVDFLGERVDVVYVVAYRHSGVAALVLGGEGRLRAAGLVGLFPLDRYLDQDAVSVVGQIELPLMLIGASRELVASAPEHTELRTLAPDPAIFTKSGAKIAELVGDFVAATEG